MLQYHHCRSLEGVVHGTVEASSKHSDVYLKDAYSWLEKEVGFYPLFLSVGVTPEDIRMSGYQNQWRRILSEGPKGKEYRKKGDIPNDVLFSFDDVDGVFMDYIDWHLVLNGGYNNYQMTDYENRLIFKPSWPKSKWLRKAKKEPHTVQLVTSEIHLPDASKIWVRNCQTRNLLATMGFENIEVRRLLLEEPLCN